MKVIGRRVLIEQTFTRKDSSIIIPGKKEENMIPSFKVLALGGDCPKGENEVQVGDTPVFESNVNFNGAKVVEEEKNIKGEVTRAVLHTFVWYDEILACE